MIPEKVDNFWDESWTKTFDHNKTIGILTPWLNNIQKKINLKRNQSSSPRDAAITILIPTTRVES